MAVIPSSQLELCRQRRHLTSALANGEWQAIAALDRRLVERVNEATDDPDRNLPALLKELRLVVEVYRDMLQQCDVSLDEVVNRLLQ